MAEVKPLLAGVLGAEPKRDDVRDFIAHCHRIAVAYLYWRFKTQKLKAGTIAGTVEQFAMDCIADLFARDDQGVLRELTSYYDGIEEADEQSLQTATRKLIFSQVNDALFRHYRQRDPTLSRIIRALKRSVHASGRLDVKRHHGRLWVVRAGTQPGEAVAVPQALLEHRLSRWLSPTNRLTEVVASMAEWFEERAASNPACPLNELALAVRSAQTHLLVADPSEPLHWDEPTEAAFERQEIRAGIREASRRVERRLFSTYVDRKVDARTFKIYVQTAGDFLTSQYVDGELTGRTRLELLSNNAGEISRAEYRSSYRNILDYMIRETRDELLNILQRRM